MEETNKIVEEVVEKVPEIVTEVHIEDAVKDGHPILKAAIIGGTALAGAVGGYLFKRHRDRRWLKDFDDGEPEVEDWECEEKDLDETEKEEKSEK